MAKTITDAGYRVVASDLVAYDSIVFPIMLGIDALVAPLPAGVQTVTTNPPYGDMPHKLIVHWLGLLEPVGGMLCLLLNARWSESKRGQVLTTRHRAYAGKVKLPERIRWFEGTEQDNGGSSQHNHCWLIWYWTRDATALPFDLSSGDPRVKRGCAVCGGRWITCAPAPRRAQRAVGRR